jgi:hypothetical protein
MPIVLFALLAVAYFASRSGAKVQPKPGDTSFVGPLIPVANTPPRTFDDTSTVQAIRAVLKTASQRTDQPYVESLFTQAGVDGWYVNDNRDGSCVIEVRTANIEAAQLALLNIPDVIDLQSQPLFLGR